MCDFTTVNMIGINSSDNNNSTANKLDSFRKFCLSIEKENLKKSKKLELEEKVLKLKKRAVETIHITWYNCSFCSTYGYKIRSCV